MGGRSKVLLDASVGDALDALVWDKEQTSRQ